jgi:hypothetical protein
MMTYPSRFSRLRSGFSSLDKSRGFSKSKKYVFFLL